MIDGALRRQLDDASPMQLHMTAAIRLTVFCCRNGGVSFIKISLAVTRKKNYVTIGLSMYLLVPSGVTTIDAASAPIIIA